MNAVFEKHSLWCLGMFCDTKKPPRSLISLWLLIVCSFAQQAAGKPGLVRLGEVVTPVNAHRYSGGSSRNLSGFPVHGFPNCMAVRFNMHLPALLIFSPIIHSPSALNGAFAARTCTVFARHIRKSSQLMKLRT